MTSSCPERRRLLLLVVNLVEFMVSSADPFFVRATMLSRVDKCPFKPSLSKPRPSNKRIISSELKPLHERACPAFGVAHALAFDSTSVRTVEWTTIVRGLSVSQALFLADGITIDRGRFWTSTARIPPESRIEPR